MTNKSERSNCSDKRSELRSTAIALIVCLIVAIMLALSIQAYNIIELWLALGFDLLMIVLIGLKLICDVVSYERSPEYFYGRIEPLIKSNEFKPLNK